MENWGLLGVAGVQLLPPKAEGRDRRKGQINCSSLKKDFFLVGYLASGCPWEAQGPLRASRVLAGWDMRYRLLPALFLCFLKPTYKGFWNIKIHPTEYVKVKSINTGWNIIMHHVTFLRCQLNFVSSFVHTYSLSDTHTQTMQYSMCKDVPVSKHCSWTRTWVQILQQVLSGQIKLS